MRIIQLFLLPTNLSPVPIFFSFSHLRTSSQTDTELSPTLNSSCLAKQNGALRLASVLLRSVLITHHSSDISLSFTEGTMLNIFSSYTTNPHTAIINLSMPFVHNVEKFSPTFRHLLNHSLVTKELPMCSLTSRQDISNKAVG